MSEPIKKEWIPEIRVMWTPGPTGVPYPAYEYEGGANHGYVSLIADPTAIDRIPELAEEPELKALVAAINAPGGEYETVAVVEPDETAGTPEKVHAVLGLIYRDRRAFSDAGMAAAFGPLFILSCDRAGVRFPVPPLLDISPMGLHDEGLAGWRLDLYVAGSGGTREAAWASFRRHANRLAGYFGGIARHTL